MQPVVALSIAGTDSAGNYGLSADLRTFAAHRVHGACAVTVVTAQNSAGVREARLMPAEFVVSQIVAITDDVTVRATKTAMLPTADIVVAIAQIAERAILPNLVVDPVLVGNEGRPLFSNDVVLAYVERLGQLARVVTPNAYEAAILADRPVRNLDDLGAAAEIIGGRIGTDVVAKGGRLGGTESVDAWFEPTSSSLRWLRASRIATPNTAGSGDTFSAAITALLATGATLEQAILGAKAYTQKAIAGAAGWMLGHGPAAIDQLHWTYS